MMDDDRRTLIALVDPVYLKSESTLLHKNVFVLKVFTHRFENWIELTLELYACQLEFFKVIG